MNTHQKYDTSNHYHFDWFTPEYNYPDAALMLVGCSDGLWILVQEFGERFNDFEEVLRDNNDIEKEPKYYPDRNSAAIAAVKMMKQIYPNANSTGSSPGTGGKPE